MPSFYVHGHGVSEEHQEKMRERMKSAPFQAKDIVAVAVALGYPENDRDALAMRVADRLIQNERKAKRIVLQNRQWTWVAPQDQATAA